MLVDTHSHLSFKAYDSDRDEVIKRFQQEGVVCIDVGTDYEASKSAVELAAKNKNIFAAVGVHPTEEGFDKEKFKKLAESKKVVAIGEIGLDYYHKPANKENQKKIFIKQLDLAKELNLPVIIHCRDAHEDMIEILTLRHGSGQAKDTGVIHSFTGNWEQAQKYVDLGFYLGINGIIFKLDLDEVIKKIPLDKILIETDCPFLTPPKAGPKDMRNEPIFVKYAAEKIAELKNISFQQVADATTQNAKKLFKI